MDSSFPKSRMRSVSGASGWRSVPNTIMEEFKSMEARLSCRILRSGLVLAALFLMTGAQFETENFIIQNAPTPQLAEEFCVTAERCRHEMAVLWLGKPMPTWSAKCPIQVRVGNFGAGGSTTFIFQGGEVYGWEMEIQGSAKRILDSVLPHEITHMVLASHFRQPVPRWLDEGAATSVEHESEKNNYRRMLLEFLREDTRRGLPFNQMVAMKDYPSDVMPFYAQGFSVVEYLIGLGGHRRLIQFAESGIKSRNWSLAVREHYGIETLGALQLNWVQWVAAGSPQMPASQPDTGQANVLAALTPTAEPRLESGSPISLVSAKPSSSYGEQRSVTPIPTKVDHSHRVAPIPSAYDIPRSGAVKPSTEASPAMTINFENAPVYR